MSDDPHHLSRFVDAQRADWPTVLAELKAGRKRSHWMWYIFPQAAGLGRSPTAIHYAIRSADEARAYLAHPLLGARLREAAQALLAHSGASAEAIMGGIDAMKLRSSMTLFAALADSDAPYRPVLDSFFGGADDPRTLAFLQEDGTAANPPPGPTGAASPRE